MAEYLQPTTNGKCLNIQYQIELKQDFEGTCCAENPHCINEMFLQPPFLPSHGQLVEPDDWQPVVYDQKQIAVPDEIYNVPTAGQVQYNNDTAIPMAPNAYAPADNQYEGGSDQDEEEAKGEE